VIPRILVGDVEVSRVACALQSRDRLCIAAAT
jgi:hypothetical protein